MSYENNESTQILEPSQSFDRRSDEAMSLKIVERFFGEVSNYLLRDAEAAFDVTVVKECLRELKQEDPDGSEAADRRIALEFAKWRDHLVKRDLDIEAFEVRRFCDAFRDSFDSKIFFSLARFYRSIPLSTSSQCKFDLMMTRAFEGQKNRSSRFAKFDRTKTADKVSELYASWPECPQMDEEAISSSAGKFDEFISEATGFMHFEELINSNIFERIRELKRTIGNSYFHSENVAAAVECNIRVGNTFGVLLAQLNSNLHLRLNSQVDFAGVLIDGSVSDRSDIKDILSELADEGELEDALSKNSDLAILQVLMRHSSRPPEEAAPDEYELDEDLADVDVQKPVLVKQRLAAQLETLAQEQPNTAILRDYMRTSPALDSLDLNDFLFNAVGEPDVLSRRALAAILCLDEFKEHDLKGAKQLEAELSNEMLSMLHFAECIGEEITDACLDCEITTQARLLVVANKLLNSRLQVERAVVRYAAPAEVVEKEPERAEAASGPDDNFGINKAAFLESNRWLMGATVLVSLVCGSIVLFSGRSSNASTFADDVQEVSTVLLPNSERLAQAIRKNDTLFITAKDSWEGMSDEEKRKDLQKMLEVDPVKPAKIAIVVDPNGRPLGDISPVGITVHAEPVHPSS